MKARQFRKSIFLEGIKEIYIMKETNCNTFTNYIANIRTIHEDGRRRRLDFHKANRKDKKAKKQKRS